MYKRNETIFQSYVYFSFVVLSLWQHAAAMPMCGTGCNQIAQAFRLAAPAEVPTVRRERTAEMEIRREREVGRAEVEAKREAAVEAEAEAEAKRRERAARRKEAEEPSRRV